MKSTRKVSQCHRHRGTKKLNGGTAVFETILGSIVADVVLHFRGILWHALACPGKPSPLESQELGVDPRHRCVIKGKPHRTHQRGVGVAYSKEGTERASQFVLITDRYGAGRERKKLWQDQKTYDARKMY